MILLPLLLSLLQFSSPELKPAGVPPPRNVLVILLDDVGILDYQEEAAEGWLPNLESIATAGVRYTSALANPTCSPGRRSMMTGRWYFRDSGCACVPLPGEEIPDSYTTLAEVCKGAGMATGLFGKWHLGDPPNGGSFIDAPAQHGFDFWNGIPCNFQNCGGVDYYEWSHVENGAMTINFTYEPPQITQALVDWWANTPGDKFAFFSPSLAHGPFHTPPPSEMPVGYPPLATGTRGRFEAMIAALDVQVGRVLSVVDRSNTLIVFAGDNGTPNNVAPNGWVGGFRYPAKGSTYEMGIRVPFAFSGPGIAPGVGSSAHLVDILPTVADWLDATPPAGIDGLSLLAPVSTYRWYQIAGNEAGASSSFCSRSANWKLMVTGDVGARTETLFHLATDPEERQPLLPANHPVVYQKMLSVLAPLLP